MKIYNNMYKVLFLLVVGCLVFTTGCTDIDEEFYSRIPEENFKAADGPIISEAFAPFTDWGNSYGYEFWLLTELTADSYCWPQKGKHGEDGGIWQRLHWHTWTEVDWPFDYAWNNHFGVIAGCNKFLEKYENITQEDVSAISIAEERAHVRALRAYMYYKLVDHWRKVPLVTTSVVDGDPQLEEAKTVLDWIISEIDAIVDDLPEKGVATGYGRFNKDAAHMLAAKVYVNYKVWTGVEKWTECIESIDKISSNIQLTPGWRDPFEVDNRNCVEHLLVLPYEENVYTGAYLHNWTLHYAHPGAWNLGYAAWNGVVCQPDHYRSFDENDLRRTGFLVGPQYDLEGNPLLGSEEANGEPLILTVDITSMTGSREDQGARNVKYTIPIGEKQMDNDWVIFRYADALLLKAECYLRLGDVEAALPYVNQIRTRAFGGNTAYNYDATTLTLDELLAERGRELSYEGHRRNDLVRYGRHNDAWWDKEVSSEDRNVFLYGQETVAANPNISN